MIKPNFLITALRSFCGGKQGIFHFAGTELYENLVWESDEYPQPSEQQVTAKVQELDAAWEAAEYQRQRAAEYPSFAEQFDTLYHGGYDAWKATVDAVKTKYPKPE
jgi:hypothetical protein